MLGGKAKRKKLLSPAGMDVRPMMEVVKGSAFDILQVLVVRKFLSFHIIRMYVFLVVLCSDQCALMSDIGIWLSIKCENFALCVFPSFFSDRLVCSYQ